MKEYLVITYVDHVVPTYQVVREKELLKILNAHREEILKNGNPSKIAVYEVGDILLDWS